MLLAHPPRYSTKPKQGTTLLAQAALGGIGLFAVIVVLLHFLETEFNPISRHVSDYAIVTTATL